MTQYFAYKKFTLQQAPRHTRILITAFNAVIFLALVVSLLNYWDKTGMTPSGIRALYHGNEGADLGPGEAMIFEKTFRELLDATHPHLFGQGVLLFILSHIVALTGLSQRSKITIYLVSFGAMLFDAALPWLIRYVSADLAPLQIVSILSLTAAFMSQLWFPVREMWFMRGRTASPAVHRGGRENEAAPERAGSAQPADGDDLVVVRKRARGRRRYRGRRNSGGEKSVTLLFLLAASPGVASAGERHARAWMIMGTALEVTLYSDSATADLAFATVHRDAARVDSLMSLYRRDSELCRINREAFGRTIVLSDEMNRVTAAALAFGEATDGAFDVTVKPMMDAWGFYRKAGRLPSASTRDSLLALSGRDRIDFDAGNGTIRFRAEGVQIDLGGIAKGYAVDLMAGSLERLGVRAALVNLGGNMRAIGAPPETPKGWPVGIRDPRQPDSILVELQLLDRSISSSGDYENFVMLEGRRYGHIIDPRTAFPAEGMAGTTVLSRDAMTADALSTALFVLGPSAGVEWARRHPECDILLVSIDKDRFGAGYAGTGIFAGFESAPAR